MNIKDGTGKCRSQLPQPSNATPFNWEPGGKWICYQLSQWKQEFDIKSIFIGFKNIFCRVGKTLLGLIKTILLDVDKNSDL